MAFGRKDFICDNPGANIPEYWHEIKAGDPSIRVFKLKTTSVVKPVSKSVFYNNILGVPYTDPDIDPDQEKYDALAQASEAGMTDHD